MGLSARRIWEHINLGQPNPFEPITEDCIYWCEDHIDVVDTLCDPPTLTGLTLGQLLRREFEPEMLDDYEAFVDAADEFTSEWVEGLGEQLESFLGRRGRRGIPAAFLPADPDSCFGIQGLRSALAVWLNQRKTERKTAPEWLNQIGNLGNAGLSREELLLTGIESWLKSQTAPKLSGQALLEALRFEQMHISVRSVTQVRETQLDFEAPTEQTLAIKPVAMPQKKRGGKPVLRNRALGYRIEKREWTDLFGHTQYWSALTHKGTLLETAESSNGLCSTLAEAIELANTHAAALLPRLSSVGQWAAHRQTGGEQYREWAITLPTLHASFQSPHFEHRNLLIHVRSDVREDADGCKFLVLQEVQSDWAQAFRRQDAAEYDPSELIPRPPWAAEWPALAMKLVLLHAAHRGLSGVSWTDGEVQVRRWKGLGARGLRELYDRTLPREANRLLKPFRRQCESIDVFLPANYRVDPTETGYAVFGIDDELVAKCSSWGDVARAIPCGAIDELQTMCGIRIDASLRAALAGKGLYAWGNGIAS